MFGVHDVYMSTFQSFNAALHESGVLGIDVGSREKMMEDSLRHETDNHFRHHSDLPDASHRD
jgi:hypothetical protein